MSLITVFVPPGESTDFHADQVINGHRTSVSYRARQHQGRTVVDLPPAIFRHLLAAEQGLKWEQANPEAIAWLGRNDARVMTGNIFPGEHRPPPVMRPTVDAAPVMVRLRAPEGVTSFSHQGTEQTVDDDSSVSVDASVAVVLRSFGFKDA